MELLVILVVGFLFMFFNELGDECISNKSHPYDKNIIFTTWLVLHKLYFNIYTKIEYRYETFKNITRVE